MPALGAFTFVLHSHVPYVRLGRRWYHAEAWIHDAIIETYIPLLETLYDLRAEGVPFRMAVGLSPVLAEQLADAQILAHLLLYLDERIAAAQSDMEYFEHENFNEHLRFLAEWYRDNFQRIKDAFTNRFRRDLIGAFRQLQDEGLIEIITTAATHAYLPLLARDGSINAQVKTAVASYERLFGRTPRTFWLPEYGYRPAQITETGRERPGLEHWLETNGFGAFLVNAHTITRENPAGVASGDIIGRYSAIARRFTIPVSAYFAQAPRDASPLETYYVSETGEGGHSEIAAVARSERLGQQVWGIELSYPRDFDYRDENRRSGTSNLPYWRVTGEMVDPRDKDMYHPDWASYKIEQHAEHFAHLVGDQLRSYNQATGEYGLVAASYNSELFGHWWFEGIQWLGSALRHLANNPDVDLTTPAPFVAQHPPAQTVDLPESSWGIGGIHFLWDNEETHWMWTPIHAAEDRMERLAETITSPTDAEKVVLAQAARELLLMQSSDWQLLVTTNYARPYAIRRFTEHVEHFDWLAESLEEGAPDVTAARALWEQDKVFADIDYRWFAGK